MRSTKSRDVTPPAWAWHSSDLHLGGTDEGHRAAIARSDSPQGPWEEAPNNPLLYNGGNSNSTVQSTGHGTMLETAEGEWYMTHLARRNINVSSPLGRETFIASVTWRNGWPTVSHGEPVLLSDFVDGLAEKDASDEASHDFQGDLRATGWSTLRTPSAPVYSQGSRAGGGFLAGIERNTDAMASNTSDSGLILSPNAYILSGRDVSAAILRKQTSLNMTFSSHTLAIPEGLPN